MKTIIIALLCFSTVNVFSKDVYVWVKLEKETTEHEKESIQKDTTTNDTLTYRYAEFLSFEASTLKNTVNLSWETGYEINTDSFIVERSIDIINWQKITAFDGAGTSSYVQQYTYIDKNPLNGISYYRIRQIDFNGTETYSKIEAIEVKNKVSNILLFPQPSSSYVEVILKEYYGEPILFTIHSSTGNPVKKIASNSSSTYIDLTTLNKGAYFIKIETNQITEMIKLIKN